MNLPNQYFPQTNNNFTTLNRIIWKAPSHQILSLQNFGEEIIQKASELENTGGILTIPYNENNEVTILFLLSFLIGKFRRNAKNIQLYRPQIDAYLKPQALSADYLLIHNLPHCDGLLENLISQDSKQVIIATGTIQELEPLQILVPYQIY